MINIDLHYFQEISNQLIKSAIEKITKTSVLTKTLSACFQIILENVQVLNIEEIDNIVNHICEILGNNLKVNESQGYEKPKEKISKEAFIDFLYRLKDRIFEITNDREEYIDVVIKIIQFLYDYKLMPSMVLYSEYLKNEFNKGMQLPDFETLKDKIRMPKETYQNLHSLFYNEHLPNKPNEDIHIECEVENTKADEAKQIENNNLATDLKSMIFNPFTFLFNSPKIETHYREGDGVLVIGGFYLKVDKYKAHTVGAILWIETNGYCYQGYQDAKGTTLIGRKIFPNGDIYKGMIKNQEMHGKGEYLFHTGRKYVGEFKDNLIKGYGELIFTNEVRFQGDFDTQKSDQYDWGNYNNIEFNKNENKWECILK